MSMLKSVTSGIVKEPLFMLVYGVDKVGKSSLGADAPNPIFIGPESGTKKLNVSRARPVESFEMLMSDIKELTTLEHTFKTVVIDTIDWLEPFVHKATVKRANAPAFDKGDLAYGRGPIAAIGIWNDLRVALEILRSKRQMNILILGHADVTKFTDPSNDQLTYDRYVLKLDKRAAAFWREAVDAVLFANHVTYATEENKKIKTSSSRSRYLYTERGAGYDAGNRYGLPPKVNLNWDDLQSAIDRGFPESESEIMERISLLLEELNDDEKREKISLDVAAAKGNVKRLSVYASRLAEIISKQGSIA